MKFVRSQYHDQIRLGNRLIDRRHFQSSLASFVNGGGVLTKAHSYVYAGVLQVQRVGMALRTITDDGDLFALD